MTLADRAPRTLPLVDALPPRHGSRSRLTCAAKCGNACDHAEPNTSGNPHVRDLVAAATSRRAALRLGLAGVAAVGLGGLRLDAALAGGDASVGRRPGGPLTFAPVPPNTADELTVPARYRWSVVAGWGDPVEPAAPAFDPYTQSPDAQAAQFGYNCDYTTLLPLPGGDALLVVNHEYTDEALMFPTGAYDPPTVARIAMMAHGLSVVQVRRRPRSGRYERVPGAARYNRRITAQTPMVVSGPAAGDPRLAGEVRGTLNNCAGGTTPWGTVLSGEENVNQYFDAPTPVAPEHVASFTRMGFPVDATRPSARQWYAVDPRFDLSTNPTQAYTFGWIVEIDPYDKTSTPVKQTMLGRFKHEGATVTLAADGRAVAYMGDDERGDYLYKFVSRDRFRPARSRWARAQNKRLLERGTLFVARLTGDGAADGRYDGTGAWIALTSDTESYVPGFSVADVLIDTRLAADAMGATRMDRPEDVERNPVNGRVYAALTNNVDRGSKFPVDEANPIAGNKHGYVLEFAEARDDAAAESFTWSLLLVCGDPDDPATYFAGYPRERVSPISCPDNVTFDPAGNLWIATDGNALGSNDGLFAVPVDGPDRGYVRQFLTVPVGAETCGPFVSDDGRTVFVAVQHPGEISGATFEEPGSTWPDRQGYPRPSVVGVWRPDGRPIGT